MSFWGLWPTDDTERNRFIPPCAGDSNGPLPATPIAVRPTADGNFCLTDNDGFVVSFYELAEILTAIKPFYEQVRDRDIQQYNQGHFDSQRDMRQPVRLAASRPPCPGYVYVLQADKYYKIGATTKVDRRIKQLSTLPPFDLELICTIKADDMYELEYELHKRFNHKRKRGEWFTLDDDDIEWIMAYGR